MPDLSQRREAYLLGSHTRANNSTRALRHTAPLTPLSAMPDGMPAKMMGVEGYACVTGVPYPMTDWLGDYTEVVDRGAFTTTLAVKDDVRLLLNHQGIPLARTKSGTLTLAEDDTGLHVAAAALAEDSQLACDICSALERGDLDQMSFMFRITKQLWSPDFTQLNIQAVELYDVSIVTFPASSATSVGLCSIDLNAAPEADARRALDTLTRRFAVPIIGTPRRALAERTLATFSRVA